MTFQISSTTGSLEADLRTLSGASDQTETEVEKSESTQAEKSDETDKKVEASDASEENLEDGNDADDSESEDDEELKDEQKEEQRPKKKGGYQKRIDKLTREKLLAAEEAQYWKEQALKGSSQKADETKPQENTQKVESKVVDDSEPDPDKFDSHKDYVKAVAKWTLDQEKKAAKAAEEQEAFVKSFNEKSSKFKEKCLEFSKEHADFGTLITNAGDIDPSSVIQDAIMSPDGGVELLYQLCKDKAEFQRINSIKDPVAQALELGRFEAKHVRTSTTKAETKKTITNAPPPINPVGKGSAPVTKSIDDPNLTFAEYEALRAQQLKTKG